MGQAGKLDRSGETAASCRGKFQKQGKRPGAAIQVHAACVTSNRLGDEIIERDMSGSSYL